MRMRKDGDGDEDELVRDGAIPMLSYARRGEELERMDGTINGCLREISHLLPTIALHVHSTGLQYTLNVLSYSYSGNILALASRSGNQAH
jgi:hypothetical protein